MSLVTTLNLGCGEDIRRDYINVDIHPLPGVDVVQDLARFPYPYHDNSFDQIIAQDVLEHLPNTVKVMEELWRILKPGGLLAVRVPHARSDLYLHDPTHVSKFTEETFYYFTQRSPSHPVSKYNYYSSARFEILELKTEFKKLRFLGSHLFFRIIHGREVRVNYGNISAIMRKVVPYGTSC